jgi:hypothetical protein
MHGPVVRRRSRKAVEGVSSSRSARESGCGGERGARRAPARITRRWKASGRASPPRWVSAALVESEELWRPSRRENGETTKGVGTISRGGTHFGGNPGCETFHRDRLIARSATCPAGLETASMGRGHRPGEAPGTRHASRAPGSVETLQNPYVSCRAIGKARASRGPGDGKRTGKRHSGSRRGEYFHEGSRPRPVVTGGSQRSFHGGAAATLGSRWRSSER